MVRDDVACVSEKDKYRVQSLHHHSLLSILYLKKQKKQDASDANSNGFDRVLYARWVFYYTCFTIVYRLFDLCIN